MLFRSFRFRHTCDRIVRDIVEAFSHQGYVRSYEVYHKVATLVVQKWDIVAVNSPVDVQDFGTAIMIQAQEVADTANETLCLRHVAGLVVGAVITTRFSPVLYNEQHILWAIVFYRIPPEY